MRNPLTIKVETFLGVVFVVSLTGFFLSLIYKTSKAFDDELKVMNSQYPIIITTSAVEKELIKKWAIENNIELPAENKYRQFKKNYPNRPWLNKF